LADDERTHRLDGTTTSTTLRHGRSSIVGRTVVLLADVRGG
jgi:hypothetical protein